MKRKIFSILLVIFLLCAQCTLLTTATEKGVSVVVDGQPVQFDVAPRLIGGRTMVPLRAIFEALGATVNWDASTKTVTAYNEISVVKCTIGSNTMYINNIARTIDVSPMIIEDRTLVPARFVAEGLNCDVQWNAEEMTVYIVSQPIDYSKVEQSDNVEIKKPSAEQDNSSIESSATPNKGTRSNPYSATDGATILYNKWSFEPNRKVSITCTNVIRGAKANSLANAENMFNDTPTSNQEWIFFEFNVKYISSEDGENDILEGSDVIYKDTFFTTNGSAIPSHDLATLGDTYKGYGVFDVKLYPGGSSKVVIGLLTDKGLGDILLRVPNNGGKENTWINCTSGVTTSTIAETLKETVPSSNTKFYSGTSIPKYDAIVSGTYLSYQDGYTDSGSYVETYAYKSDLNSKQAYVDYLEGNGWDFFDAEVEDEYSSWALTKGNTLLLINYYFSSDNVYLSFGNVN